MDDWRSGLRPSRSDRVQMQGIEITAQRGESSLILSAECPRS
jgi:hypothetical protein